MGARGVEMRRRRVREGNCREECLASEGTKRVERSEFNEGKAEDVETESAMGTIRTSFLVIGSEEKII